METPLEVKGKNDKELYELELSVNSLTQRARWWWGTAPSETRGESTKQYSSRLWFFCGGDAREYPGGLLRLDPAFADGSGPYQLVDYVPGQVIDLERSPLYVGVPKPKIERITLT